MKKIAIFIPTYNAARTLPVVLDRIPPEIKNKVQEIFIIDDASQDNTHLIAIGYQQQSGLANLKVFKNEENRGYGDNQKLAYQYCLDQGFDMVAMLHGDAQYAPELLPSLIEPVEKNEADMVFGSRLKGRPLKGGMPLYKFLGNRLLTIIENWVLKMDLSEFHSGYRVYSCQALRQIPFQLCSDDFHFDTEILIQFRLKGLRIIERPIPTYYGSEKSHVRIFQYGFNILAALLAFWLHQKGWRRSPKFDLG